MATTIYIGNDITTSTMKTLFGEQDFVDLVDEYMGRDSRRYLNDIIEQRNDAIKERDEAIKYGGYSGGYQDGFDAGFASK